MRPTVVAALLSVLVVGSPPVAAQHHGAQPPPAEAGEDPQPYATLPERRVKALSEQQEADLRAGRGMGLALAAELNGYPGPAHVLEHADALRLAPAQRVATMALRDRMTAEAQAIGTQVIVLEEALDTLFTDGVADTGQLAALTAALGGLNGRLREVHLVTHIAMRDALDPVQRGFGAQIG